MAKHYKLKIELKINGEPRRFPPEAELVIFRIVQESLRNVGKHAMASHVWVAVDFKSESTTFTIRDDGRGFHPPDRIGDLAVSGKLGLTGMQERAQLIGSKLSIKSVPGEGTMVAVELPTPAEQQDHTY